MEDYKTFISQVSKYGKPNELMVTVLDAELACTNAQQGALLKAMDIINELRHDLPPSQEQLLLEAVRRIASIHNKLNKNQ